MFKKHKILVVEDEKELARSTVDSLSEQGFVPFHAEDLLAARVLLKKENFSVVLLDLSLPDGDGMSLIQEIKALNQNVGLIIVSAKDTITKKVQGLELGADDYLTKPFFFSELNARLKSVIRRLDLDLNQRLIFEEITLFPEEMRVLVYKKEIDLTPKEFGLLLYFFSNQNRVISKINLGEFISSNYSDYGFNDDMLYTHIKNLKKKLSEGGSKDYIKNIYGIGYKFTIT